MSTTEPIPQLVAETAAPPELAVTGNGGPPLGLLVCPPLTLWLTGLSGAGKTTLALAIERALVASGRPACVLDGDELRKGLTWDLGLSDEDRSEQARRAAHVAALTSRAGVIAVVALISPYADDRRRAREIHEQLGLPFLEVWVDTPLQICERRDPKGLYARARAGELHGLTGLDAPYEPPRSPDLKVEGYGKDPDLTAKEIVGSISRLHPGWEDPAEPADSPKRDGTGLATMPGLTSELAFAADGKPAFAADGNWTDLPELSLVIVTWNSGRELLDCVRSLHEHPPSTAWEAIVVDNGSTDGSIEELRSQFPLTRVVANRRNRGLAAANNQGIAASRGEFVLISNPDVIYSAGAVDALLDLMRRRPRAAFAIAKHVHPDGGLQPAAGDLPTIREALLGQRLLRRRSAGLAGVWWHSWPHDEERTVGHGAEACYLVRRSAIGEIGLQDDRFVLDWEGLDWSRRAWQAGWEIWFCPSAVVTHLGGVSIRKAIPRWVVSSHLGMYRYFAASSPSLLWPLLAAVVGIRAITKFAAPAFGVRAYVLARRRA